MSAAERRLKIVELLCIRRRDTYRNLAYELGVSRETIRHDIMVLMCSYPIETVRGRYGGCVKVKDDYWPYRDGLDSNQIDYLLRTSKTASREDLPIVSSILFQFAPNQRMS